jgi:ankyrin repeat protein
MDIYGRSAIHYACEKDYFFSIMYLLNKGVDTTITDSEGNTPLAICFIRRNLNQAALLLRLGVKQGFVFENGEKTTYFSYAFNKLSVAVCYMLLDNGYPLELAL